MCGNPALLNKNILTMPQLDLVACIAFKLRFCLQLLPYAILDSDCCGEILLKPMFEHVQVF